MSLVVQSPVAGTTAPLSEVPDAVFAEEMVGPGIAVTPAGGPCDAVAPVDGTIATLQPHAFVVAAAGGQAVLVHLGIDTVKQKGEGFTMHVEQGDAVRAGQPVASWDPDVVQAAGYSPIVPVIALDAGKDTMSELATGRSVAAGDELFTWTR